MRQLASYHRGIARIVYYCAASLDGYIAESDDSIAWLTGYEGSFDTADAESHPMQPGGAYERFYDGVGALVSGSVTYEWIVDHMQAGAAWPYSGKPYWVLSSRDLRLPPGAAGDDVRIVSRRPAELIGELRAAAGDRDIWIIGGGNVASQFADEGLLDELHVTVVPVVLGDGKPLFDHRIGRGPLKLLGTSVFGNGMVELRYAAR